MMASAATATLSARSGLQARDEWCRLLAIA